MEYRNRLNKFMGTNLNVECKLGPAVRLPGALHPEVPAGTTVVLEVQDQVLDLLSHLQLKGALPHQEPLRLLRWLEGLLEEVGLSVRALQMRNFLGQFYIIKSTSAQIWSSENSLILGKDLLFVKNYW